MGLLVKLGLCLRRAYFTFSIYLFMHTHDSEQLATPFIEARLFGMVSSITSWLSVSIPIRCTKTEFTSSSKVRISGPMYVCMRT